MYRSSVFFILLFLLNIPSVLTPQNLSPEQIKPYQVTLQPQDVRLILDDQQTNISLNGSWQYFKAADNDLSPLTMKNYDTWSVMPLPSNWFLQGMKTFPDPGQGLDYHGSIWFIYKFNLPKKYQGKQITLNFDMVDYYTDIFINNCYVNSHQGCFQDFKFNIEDKLRYGAENILLVRVNSPFCPVDLSGSKDKTWPVNQFLIKGVFAYHDARPGGKSRNGQDKNTGGIIGDIWLNISDAVQIERMKVSVISLKEEANIAEMKLDIRVYNALKKTVAADLVLDIQPYNFQDNFHKKAEEKLTLDPGWNTRTVTFVVENPQLWWTWDFGKPNLYRLQCSLANNRKVLDRRAVRFGIRTFVVGRNWKCYLNNKWIFLRGSNYISSQWLSEMDREKYSRDVRLMKECNLNSIRVHAHIEKDAFYDLCDENGILVWQDFPLQWGYTDADDFQQDAVRQIRDMVNKLYNHPGIVIWCAHNESPWASDWMKKKAPDQNKKLDEALYQALQAEDITRYAHKNSGTGDAHVYNGWYSGHMRKFRSIPGAPMITEYGAQALPVYSTMQKMLKEKDLFPAQEEQWQRWAYFNFQKEEMFRPERVLPGESIKQFIRNSQAYQAQLLKFATENYRMAQAQVMGIFQFMFTDCWPSITWSVLDYYREPKAGYEVLKRSMAPVMPVFKYDSLGNFRLFAVNDLPQTYVNCIIKWEILRKDNSVFHSDQKKMTVFAQSSTAVTNLKNLKKNMEKGFKMSAKIYNSDGQLIGENELLNEQWIEKPKDVDIKYPFKRASASSEINPSYFAVDADATTAWESDQDNPTQTLILELERILRLKKVIITWDQGAAAYQVRISLNGKDWKTIADIVDGLNGERREILFITKKVRYIQIICLKPVNNKNYSIREIDYEQ